MAKVAAVSGAVGEDFEALRAKAREAVLRPSLPSDAASGMEMLARAGFDAVDLGSDTRYA